MTYEQYWYGDPLMVRAFYKADRIRRKRTDEEAWLNGMYVLAALSATVGNIGKRPGEETNEYPKEPFTAEEKKKKTAEAEQTEEEKQREATLMLAWMTNMVQSGKNWGKRRNREGR